MVACASPLLSPSCPVIYDPPSANRRGAERDPVELEGWKDKGDGWGSLRELKGRKGEKYLSFERTPDMCLHFLPTFTINSFLTLGGCALAREPVCDHMTACTRERQSANFDLFLFFLFVCFSLLNMTF